MKKLLNNVIKGYMSTLIGLCLIFLDIFFFFWGEIELVSFVTIIMIGLALFLLDEESLLKWIKNKLDV